MSQWRAWLGLANRVADPHATLAVERAAARRGDLETALKGYHALLRAHAVRGTEPDHGPPPPTALLLEQAGAGAPAADALRIDAAPPRAKAPPSSTATSPPPRAFRPPQPGWCRPCSP